MTTKIKIYLACAAVLAGGLLGNFVFAQQALPSGGGDFTQAAAIGYGAYQGTLAPGADFYYQTEVKTGQEINIKGGFGLAGGENMYSWGNVYVYDKNKQELFSEYGAGGTMGPWLSKSDQILYIRMLNEQTEDILTYDLEITLQNRFDAASQTDAGDTFEKALPIAFGSYTGYLAGVSVMQTPYGDDFRDYYKISVKKGISYEFKLTPLSAEDEAILELYNANRELIDEKTSPNKGAVASLSLTPQANTSVYLAVGCGYKAGIFSYKLEAKSSAVLTKFYNCKDSVCGFAGSYSSLQECQQATAKACYQTSDCAGKCKGAEPVACSSDSDCPADYPSCVGGKCVDMGEKPPVGVCQSECNSGQTKCFDNFNYYKCGDYNKDGCFEWASPVYCGEGNKCASGKCAKAQGCQCSQWQGAECGASGCAQDQTAETRICAPAACDIEKICQSDASCQIMPPPLPPSGIDVGTGTGAGWFKSFRSGFNVWHWFGGFYIIFWILIYVYSSFCLQTLARKTGTKDGWMAWVPFANIFLALRIAQKPLWWFILVLISIVNIVVGVIVWMKIAERRGKPDWWGILMIIPVVNIVVLGCLAFSNGSGGGQKTAPAPYAEQAGGTQEANKPVVGYKHACKYCDKLIPPNSNICPFCKKSNPLGPCRCPKCREPIEKEWQVCAKCNQDLRIVCPFCKKVTFFGDHCEDCGARLLITCPNCGQEQPPLGDKCIKCGQALEKPDK
ncbi:MAG: DUF5684 domain-containing protein [Patescibacteria group bacterium]|nr:DUF5684 domain-containing protein [Patescibacteria group bacterium]